ncbi:MAG: DUF1015 domain-containing protein [Clostridiaceae bacterium]|nr:DUF1015 domain-containing protein [Clostridiaceae bacterium]
MISSRLREIFNSKLGIDISSILLPQKNVDMQRWAVVACDQFTSEPEYWEDVHSFVGENPSTLHLIFPEAYLETESPEEKSNRIKKINENMNSYMKNQVFYELTDSVVLVERTFANGIKRHGIILAVDLENYDYKKGSQSLIRATEGTIVDRLPPRICVRENAPLELPHIMVLIDDKDKTVIEPLKEKKVSFSQVYSFELMKESGSIKGWKISDEKDLENIANGLLKLADKEGFKKRYGVDDKYGVLLFAVGDGNHSLATAKACWDKIKQTLSEDEAAVHPARYALVEVVNVHDDGLVFEPIHRVIFNVDENDFINEFREYFKNEKGWVAVTNEKPETKGHAIKFVTRDTQGYLIVEKPSSNLEVGTLQKFLDDYINKHPDIRIDYIHGEEITEKLGKQPKNMGFFLPHMDKNELFRTVILDGVLPRKTFSMGEASEKRFYLEARKIR